MSTQGLEGLERTVQLTHIWINDLDRRLEWNNKARSYRLLKAVLHSLRDSLHVKEVADLGAQLPALLRGAFYEQWKPVSIEPRKNNVAEFLAQVQLSFIKDPLINPAGAVMAVFHLLTQKVTEGEIEDVKRCLPPEVRAFWPEMHKTPGARPH